MIMVARLIALASLISTLEFISLKRYFSEQSIWRWSEIKKEHPFLDHLDFLLAEEYFIIFLILRALACMDLIIFPESFILSLFLFASALVLALRFRGSFNGGSDYMSLVILSALCVANSSDHQMIKQGAMLYIALQVCTSYFMAGVVKIKQYDWRSGVALQAFLVSPNYRPPQFLVKFIRHNGASVIASWLVMLFELMFPLIFLLKPTGVMVALLLAFSFHFINNLLLGLNRFMWVWPASYPALYFSVIYVATISKR